MLGFYIDSNNPDELIFLDGSRISCHIQSTLGHKPAIGKIHFSFLLWRSACVYRVTGQNGNNLLLT